MTKEPDEALGRNRPALPVWFRPLDWLGATVLLTLMLLTTADVAGRYLFDSPVPGGFYWVGVLMALLIFAGLPAATLRDEHLRAGLLEGLFAGPAGRWQRPLVLLVAAFCLGVLAWRLWLQGERFARARASVTTIDVPLAWLAWFGAVMTAAAVLAALFLAATRRRD